MNDETKKTADEMVGVPSEYVLLPIDRQGGELAGAEFLLELIARNPDFDEIVREVVEACGVKLAAPRLTGDEKVVTIPMMKAVPRSEISDGLRCLKEAGP